MSDDDSMSPITKAMMIFFGAPLVYFAASMLMRGDMSGVTAQINGTHNPRPAMYTNDKASHFASGERETTDASYIHNNCVQRNQHKGFNFSDAVMKTKTDYMTCYIGAMTERPQRVCEPGAKARLIRYTNYYFKYLDDAKRAQQMGKRPEAAGIIAIHDMISEGENQGRIEGGGTIEPDPMVVDGYRYLVQKGALKLADFGYNGAPALLAAQIKGVKPKENVCP
jgi:hypothetical protein